MPGRYIIIWIFVGLSGVAHGQKSRVLSVFQLIEAGKYEEAKEAIELAVWNDKTSRWPRTYYAKGLLCQTAFESGFSDNDPKKTNLYPDQLLVAYEAYEKAVELDTRNKIRSLIETQYYGLANSFQKVGEQHFLKREYSRAMTAFEHALLISKSPLISVETDTSLVYNTAIASYQSKNWDKAISYLTGLNSDSYSPNTALLLYRACIENGDSLTGEQVLSGGVERYDYDQTIVLQMVDLLVATGRPEKALDLLDRAVETKPGDHYFIWTRGLIYQQAGRYEEAITDFKRASELAPADAKIYYDLGISYYNMGVETTESARLIRNNKDYQAARLEARNDFQEAVNWFEKAYQINPGHQPTISRLYQLYQRLQMTEKEKRIEPLIR